MEPIHIFPGSFCPPTYGHLKIVEIAAELFPEIIIICSVSPDKPTPLFSPQECKTLWRTYHLPPNAKVMTLNEFTSERFDLARTIMIRGIRGKEDLEYEKEVVLLNLKVGITKYLYIVSDEEFRGVSSSMARKLAKEENLPELRKLVSCQIIEKLAEKLREGVLR